MFSMNTFSSIKILVSLITICLVFNSVEVVEAYRSSFVLNDRPIIGILAQEKWTDAHSHEDIPPNNTYIAASYVKYIEGAGARVVPIFVDRDETYLREIFNSVNGILYPGGTVSFVNRTSYKGGFYRSALFLYNLAKEANDAGDYFPLWGTCLGFEVMLFMEAGNKDFLANCAVNNKLERLKLTKDSIESRLYGKAPKSIVRSLQTKPIAANFHNFCATPENFTKFGLDKQYKILSTNYDSMFHMEFISTVESIKYPFYAVQFHPEKNLYEWTTKEKLPHFPEALQTSQYFANFFVNEARKNNHKFKDADEELKTLIYNYSPEFTGAIGSTFSQQYLFQF